MKKLMFFGLFISLFGVTSCDVGDDDVLCTTGPVGLYLELVDAETGANLYANDTFQQAAIDITDENGVLIPYNFMTELDRIFLRLNLGTETGEKIITIQPSAEVSLDLELTLARQEGNCDTYFISEFDVSGYEYDQEGVAGVVRILFHDLNN